ncbi:Nek1 [Symbiodinium natans]|uniref:non-specific serine/threonine protein kinase n=1 Tax=Symbiodinium natans TaxID=878477 RepID=A0A812UR90_9DINO|nr:Nek1 [Symbiodinium natans]
MDEKYQRIKVLGKGSFGKAYLVKNTEENALCVVKQMETSAMEPKERNEAVKEAMLLKKMDHPNIVRFKEDGQLLPGRGGATGIHAPSAGRAEALKNIGRNMVLSGSAEVPRDGHEEWLQQWTRTGSLAPFATNYFVREAPAHMQWHSNGQAKGSTLTAQRVLNKGGPEALLSETARSLARHPPQEGLRAAGAPSGRTDRDFGRIGALNCGRY